MLQQRGRSSAPRARLDRPRYKLTPKVKQPRRFANISGELSASRAGEGGRTPMSGRMVAATGAVPHRIPAGDRQDGCGGSVPCVSTSRVPPRPAPRRAPGRPVSKGTEQALPAGPHRTAAEGCTAFSTALTPRDNKGDLTWRGSTEPFGNQGVKRADGGIRGCRPSVLTASPQASQAGGEQREPGCTHLCQSPGPRGRHRRSPPVFCLHPALPAQPRARPGHSLGPAPAQPAAAQPA